MMHILVVTQYFWPEAFRINDLVLSLQTDYGHEVTVLTGLPNYPKGKFYPGYSFFGPRREKWNNVNIVRVPLLPRGKKSKISLALNYISFAVFSCVLGPWKCRGKYDLIFVAQYSPVTVALPAILLKKIKKIPLLLWVQDLWPDSLSATGAIHSKGLIRLVGFLVAFIYRHSDRVLVQSEAFFPHINTLCEKIQTVDFLPNWTEGSYQPCKPDYSWGEQVGLPTAGFKVIFAGNIGVAQDFETIISAAEILRDYADIHWVIIGDGSAKDWVAAEIVRRNIVKNFHLMGQHPSEEMPRFFALADALLVTLKKDPIFSMTVPSKVQSYLACARPILAAIDGEGRRIISEAQAGLVCESGAPTQLADIVLRLYNSPSHYREAMGRRGRDYYEKHFDRERLITKLNQLFEQAQKKE